MIKKKIILAVCTLIWLRASAYDLTIVGFSKRGASIAEHGLSFLRCLHSRLKIQFVACRPSDILDLPQELHTIIAQDGLNTLTSHTPYQSPVIVITDHFISESWNKVKPLTQEALRLFYAVTCKKMCNPSLVLQINQCYDALLVPDAFDMQAFTDSGVKIPIFILPLAVEMEHYASHKPLSHAKPFIFGSSGLFGNTDRKNHKKLIDAFVAEFGNQPNVQLVIHGRKGKKSATETLEQKIKKLNVSNITLLHKMLSPLEYRQLITSFNCYVLISKGEGFSLSPREAMAAKIPCILSNNTAHTTICNSGFVYSVQSDKTLFSDQNTGLTYDCSLADVRKGLRDVYSRYQYYLTQAEHGSIWVKQYSPDNLQKKYINIVQPKKIIYGDKNIVTDELLITNSEKLYIKYKNLFKI